MNAGPARIPQWMVTLDHCRELGVTLQVFTNVNEDTYLCNESAGMTGPERYRTDAWQHGASRRPAGRSRPSTRALSS